MSEIDGNLKGSGNNFRGRLFVTLIASAIVVSLLMTMLITLAPSEGNPPASNVPAHLSYAVHPTIWIDGDADFAAQALAETWPGDGSPGNPYIIEGWDISAASANGIEIDSTTVHFIIRNCYVHDGVATYEGIYLYDCVNGTVTGNICSNNWDGIYLESSSGNTVSNNTLSNNDQPDQYGLYLYYSSNNILSNNNCSDNEEGICIEGSSDGNTISNNSCNSNNWGIDLWDTCNYNILFNNTCSDNVWEGILLYLSINNTLIDNTCNSNDDDGISLWSSSGNILFNNNCSDNVWEGIWLEGSSSNMLFNNTCSNNLDEGIWLNSSSDSNILVNNTCSSNAFDGIGLSGSNDNILVNNTCSSNFEDGIWLGTWFGPSSNGNTLINNTCSNNVYDGIYLESSGSNTISNNNCSSNTQHGINLDSSSFNTVVDNNCNLNDGHGIRLLSSSFNTVSDNTCIGNTWVGIILRSSSINDLSNNNCSNNADGIWLWFSSDGNTISNNNCSDNFYVGIYLESSGSNTLLNNTCSNNVWEGIELESSSYFNTLSYNNCSNNGEEGIWLNSSGSNTLNNNTCSSNAYDGIGLSGSNDNILIGNNCSSNNEYGIWLGTWFGPSSDGNAISRNQLCNNAQYGVEIDSGSTNTIWNNILIDNNGGGVQAYDDGTNNWWNSSSVFGNYWSDLTGPDNIPPSGVVDWSYNLTGSAGAKDFYPLTTPSIPTVTTLFSPPHSDYGVDTNANTLYDWLDVDVVVDVATAGWYEVDGDLYGGGWWIDDDWVYTYLNVGIQTVTLQFSGIDIYSEGYNGAFDVYLDLYDASWNWLDNDTYTTSGYLYTEFEHSGDDAYEVDDVYTQASTITPGSPQTHSINDGGTDVDWVTFTLSGTSDVVIETDGMSGDTRMWLYDSSGVPITWIRYDDDGGNGAFSRISASSLPADTYYVKVDEYGNNDEISSYTITLTVTPPTPPDATFSPPHSDHGVDTNANGLWDWLNVDVVVDVASAGWYEVEGGLYDGSGGWIDDDSSYTFLGAGLQTVTLQFSGIDIGNYGYSGAFDVYLDLYDGSWNWLDGDTHTTSGYLYTEFEQSSHFQLPHSDYGVDTSGSALFEYLVVDTTVDVKAAGTYTVLGALFGDMTNMTLIGVVFNTTYLGVGTHLVQLWFPAGSIISYGLDGPYVLLTELLGDMSNLLDMNVTLTNPYTIGQFQVPPAMLEPPYTDYGEDTNANGLYDYLVVNVTVNVTTAGWYTVAGDLSVMLTSILTASNYTYLTAGVHTVKLRFDGALISVYGFSGSYLVFLSLDDNSGALISTGFYTTNPYAASQFERIGMFVLPHSDYGVDTSGSALFEYLVVDTTVDIKVAGTYTVIGALYGNLTNMTPFAVVFNTTYLGVGTHLVQLWFPAGSIISCGVDGPYGLETILMDDLSHFLDMNMTLTNPYTLSQFQAPPAMLEPPHADYGEDTNANGLYDYLVVNVTVNVTTAGWYTVAGDLNDMTLSFIDTASNYTYLTAGVHTVKLRFDGTLISANGVNGPYYVFLSLDDNSGVLISTGFNITKSYLAAQFESGAGGDTTPPTTTIGLAGTLGSNGWYVSSVTVTLTRTDNVGGSGINYTKYRIDGGSWLTYTAPFSISADGTHTVEFYSVDLAGNTEATKSSTVKIDKIAPTGSVVINSGAAYTNSRSVTLTLTANDVTSGINQVRYSNDSVTWSAWAAFSSPKAWTLSAGDGAKTVYYQVRDAAGMVSTFTDGIVLDLTAPVTNYAANGYDLTLSALDGGSGVDYTMYRIDGGLWQTYTGTITPGASGTYFVEFNSTDNAGNTEGIKSVTLPLTADTIPPVTTASTAGTSQVTVTLTATDIGTGVNYTKYRIDGGSWLTYSAPIVLSTVGSHTVEFYSVDLASNTEATKNITVQITETVPPVTTASPSGTSGLSGWYKSNVTVTLTATDNVGGSGINYTKYRIDGGSWLTYTVPFSISADGTHTVEFYSVDLAGNTEATKNITVKIDNTAPTSTASKSGSAVTISSSDATSGVNKTLYRIDGGAWLTYTGAFNVTATGNHTIEYYSIDEAGNAESIKTIYVNNDGGGAGIGVTGDLTPMLILLGVIAAAIAISLFFLAGKRKKKRDEAQPPQQPKVVEESVKKASPPQQPKVVTRSVKKASPPPPPPPPPPETEEL